MNYLLHRLAGRILRRVIGIKREPVRQPTESQLRHLDHAYGFLVGISAMGTVTVILLLLMGRPTC